MTSSRKSTRTGLDQRGVTLIELLIVMVILALLSTMALSSYRRYTLRANRTDATTTLFRIQVAQEKFFLQNNRYAATLAEVVAVPPAGLGITLATGSKTLNGYYTITLPSATATTYQARADAAGVQIQDSSCTYFTIDQSGSRAPDPATGCWR